MFTSFIILALLAIFLYRRIRTYLRLAHIPGPRYGGWSRIPMVLDNISGRCHEYLYDYTLKYGPLMRIGPNHLITSDFDVYHKMYAPNSRYKKAEWYGVFRFNPRKDNLFSTTDEARHAKVKRQMAAGYAGREVPHMEEHIDKHVMNWVDLIERKYVSAPGEVKPMDIAKQAQFFTLDVISDLAYNQSFGDLVDDRDNFKYVETAEKAIISSQLLALFPGLHRWLEQSRLMDAIAPSTKDISGLGAVIAVAEAKVAERFRNIEEQKDRQDMLGSFVRHGLSQSDAEGEAVLQILAGADTTATVIRVVLLHVLSSPQIFASLRKEIDDGVREGRMSSPITDAEAKASPYLQGCIKEAIRLWPPALGISLKVVPPEGDTVCGYKVPGGTFLGHNAWAFGRDASIYGPDLDMYRPERWIEASGKQLELMERNKELTFAYGRFKCLGQPVAYMELNKVFVELLRKFDFAVMHPDRPWSSASHGLFIQKDFFVRVSTRE